MKRLLMQQRAGSLSWHSCCHAHIARPHLTAPSRLLLQPGGEREGAARARGVRGACAPRGAVGGGLRRRLRRTAPRRAPLPQAIARPPAAASLLRRHRRLFQLTIRLLARTGRRAAAAAGAQRRCATLLHRCGRAPDRCMSHNGMPAMWPWFLPHRRGERRCLEGAAGWTSLVSGGLGAWCARNSSRRVKRRALCHS